MVFCSYLFSEGFSTRYFAGSDCNDPRANASVVPWISPQDPTACLIRRMSRIAPDSTKPKENPINDSFIAVYSDPLLPHLLGATDAAKLCAEEQLDGVGVALKNKAGHASHADESSTGGRLLSMSHSSLCCVCCMALEA